MAPVVRSAADHSWAIEAGSFIQSEAAADGLLQRLAGALDAHRVAYCQWKGHWSAHRWASGHGDVDLLVDHDSMTAFRDIAGQLGFRPALPSGERQIPGVESFFGHDPLVARLLHLHVHYRLVLGDYWRTAYRIPIERPLLEAAIPGSIFRIPSPAYQYLLFVLRMVLRQRGRPMLWARSRWLSGIEIQLASLEASTDRDQLRAILNRHLPAIDLPFFERCARSLRGECGPAERAALTWRLHRRLWAHARRPPLGALMAAAVEKILPRRVSRRVLGENMRLTGGGTVVALVGGDGAGKSTCARELTGWLAPSFATMRAHLGLPPRSLLTLIVGGALRGEQALGRMLRRDSAAVGHAVSYIELLRYLCTARDRYRLYQKVRRFGARGGIAICERYPIPQNRLLVGPCIPTLLSDNPSLLARLLGTAELSYYNRMLPPDALFVLRLDPDLAVLRKRDEPAEYVRARGRVIWNTDWSGTTAQVVDASRPLPEVLTDLKTRVWSAL
jgi:hypothetical protein